MADKQTEAPTPGPSSQSEPAPSQEPETPPSDSAVPAFGKRAAFRDLRRQLTEEELKNSGVQKLLLEMLKEADDNLEELRSFENQFHETDKKAAVLKEQLKTHNVIEIFFGIGVGLGGAIIGLTPFLWTARPAYGVIALVVGCGLMIGSAIGRIIRR